MARNRRAAAAAAQELETVDIEETPAPEAKTDEERMPLDVSADEVEIAEDDEIADAIRAAGVAEPAAEETTEEEAEPAKPAKPAAAAPAAEKPQPPKDKLLPALQRERGKRQRLAQIAEAAITQRDNAEQALRQLQMAGVVIPPRDAAKLADIKKKADEAQTMGEVVDMVVDFVEDRYKTLRSAERDHDLKIKVAKCEVAARDEHDDYDALIGKAGILDATKIVNGQYANPRIAFEIYLSDNPAETAYALATEILKKRGELPEETTDEVETPEPPKKPAAPKPAAAAPAAPAAPAKPKPRGINNVQPAGKPTLKFTRQDLDRLMEKNPSAYENLIKRRPELGDWHLGKE